MLVFLFALLWLPADARRAMQFAALVDELADEQTAASSESLNTTHQNASLANLTMAGVGSSVQGYCYGENTWAYQSAGKKLGEGAFGSVELMTNRATQMKVAMKTVSRDKFNPTEVEIMSLGLIFNMPVLDVFWLEQQGTARPEGWAIAMPPFGDGELNDHGIGTGSMDRAMIQDAMLQLAIGLHSLHLNGVLHGDVKPQNAVVRGDLVAWIDYGISTTGCWADGIDHNNAKLGCTSDIKGTPVYIAPNMWTAHELNGDVLDADWWNSPADAAGQFFAKFKHLEGQVGYGPEVDWWAWALTYYKLLTGKSAFGQNKASMATLKRHIRNHNIDWRALSGFREESEFLQGILTQEGYARLQRPISRVRMWQNARASQIGRPNAQGHPILASEFWSMDLRNRLVRPPYAQQDFMDAIFRGWKDFKYVYPLAGKCTTGAFDVANVEAYWVGGASCGLERVCDTTLQYPTNELCKDRVAQLLSRYQPCHCEENALLKGCCCPPGW